MADKTDEETNGCIFQWKIEIKNHCCLTQGVEIESPVFIADALGGTKWSLQLYPMGKKNEKYVGVYLHRGIDCCLSYEIKVYFLLAFLGKDDEILTEKPVVGKSFRLGQVWGYQLFEERKKVFVAERKTFLPEDTLTVQCTIWNEEWKPAILKYFYARTIFSTNSRSYEWRIDKFSTRKSSLRNKFKDTLIEFDLVLNEGMGTEKGLVIYINSLDERIKYFSLKTSVLDSEGKKEDCGILEYFADDLKRGKLSSVLLSFQKLIQNKSQYFPRDVLSLNCEHVIFTQTDFYEYFGSGITYTNIKYEVDESINEQNIENEKSINTPVLKNDLKFMYIDAIFTDTELRTSTQNFPAHKAILSARSPVFRRMFSHDMKEKKSGQVNINDLEDDTIHRMLLYIYTDSLEDLEIASALQLYAAAEKYEILSLKSGSSSFLKQNLCPNKACEVLLLAEQYQDVDLKSFVQDYILEHDKEVFGSQEWKDFMETNLKLAAGVMYRKVYPM